VSAVILATAIAMFVLFRYDPEASTRNALAGRPATDFALKAELGHIGEFFSRVSINRVTRAAAATLAAIAFGVLEDATHEVVIGLQLHPTLKAMADGFIVALCGGAMVWIILTAVSRRHQHAKAQQQALAGFSQEVHSALAAILMANRSQSAKERETVIGSVERIEAAMSRAGATATGDGPHADKPAAPKELRARLASSAQ
jgi:hypothetical protein